MKKTNKVIIKTLSILFVLMLVITTNVFASGPISTSISTGGKIDSLDGAVSNVWGSITTIVQVLAFTAIIFAGLRYMFASADTRADIKKQMAILMIGAILVFATSTVVQFVQKAAGEALSTTTNNNKK